MVFKPIYTLEVGYIIMIIMCKSWGYISIFTRFINLKKKKMQYLFYLASIYNFKSLHNYVLNLIFFSITALK
jgi:hypothetical protein